MSEVRPVATSEPLKVVLVDESKDARDAARDRADARLSEELNQGNGFQKFVKGIWKGGLAKEYYRQKYTAQAHHDIRDAQDVLIHENVDAESRSRSMQATIEQFQDGADELIHQEAGERRVVLENDSELAVGVKDLIRQFAEGRLNEVALREERTRLLNDYRATHGTDEIGEGVVAVDNMIQVAEAVRGAVEHGESMDHVMATMQVIAGEARTGVRGEARYNAIDKVVDKISKTRIGALVGPETIGLTAAVVAGVARWGSTSVAISATKFIIPGVVAGTLAGAREGKRVEDERNQHGREMAQGKEFGEADRRRSQMEAARYSTLSATELTERLAQAGSAENLEGGSAAVLAALDALAEVQTRIGLSDRDKRDYISYSDVSAVGDERMLLDRARAEVRVALEARLTDEMRDEMQIQPGLTVAELVAQRSELHMEMIQEDMTEKDRAFRLLKARRVAQSAAIAAATSLVGGVIVQEAVAAANPNVDGIVDRLTGQHAENMADGMHHQTLLNGLIEGDKHVVHTEASDSYDPWQTTLENENGQIMLSDDHTLAINDDGTFNLVDGNGHATVENLVVDENGILSEHSIERLEDAGMTVDDYSFDKDVTVTTQEQVNSDQFVQNHMAETTQVTRDLWYGNDTPSPNYDENELRVYRGGAAEAPGIIEGGYQYTVAGMHADGSWQGGERVDWNQAAASGNLFFAVSATSDTQGNVFMIPIGPDGAINIPADSPAGHFFSNENGSVVFHGAYGEVVQATGTDANGEVHIRPLATMVGDQNPGVITDTITTTTVEHHGNYNITTAGFDTTSQNFTEIPVGAPIESRRTLEAVRNRQESRYYYQGGDYLSAEEIAQERREISPTLLRNPNAVLDPRQEFARYRQLVAAERGAAYVAEIDRVIDETPELRDIAPDLDSVIKIPVDAAGEEEAQSIYNLLVNGYGGQENVDGKNLILLHVNWRDTYEGSGRDETTARETIERTRSEIARALADRPDLNIAVIESEWKASEIQSGVIGFVNRKMDDALLFALNRATESGRMTPDHDVLIIRNDADAKGIATNYLQRFQQAAALNPEADVFTGTTTFDNATASRLPGFTFSANFMQSLDLLSAKREGVVHTGGANFAVRASMYAAIGGSGVGSETGAGTDDVMIGRRIRAAREGNLLTPREKRRATRRGYYYARSSEGNARKIAVRTDARLETNADRQEALYQAGIPMMASWNDFDTNGHLPRTARLGDASKESIAKDGPAVIERIRNELEGSINMGGYKRSVIDTGLAFAFGTVGTEGYRLIRRGGRYRLEITTTGAQYLSNHLTRIKGQFDPFGNRKMRQLYGQVKPGAKRQPQGRPMIRI